MMPNWCENVVTFTGPRAKLEVLIDGASKGELLNAIRPMPENVFRGPLSTLERAKYGTNNWYDWSVEHWGTKWDVNDVDIEDEGEGVTFRFNTAWTPPIAAYQYAEEQGLAVAAMFCDEGFGVIGRYGDGVYAGTAPEDCDDDELRDCFPLAFLDDDDDDEGDA